LCQNSAGLPIRASDSCRYHQGRTRKTTTRILNAFSREISLILRLATTIFFQGDRYTWKFAYFTVIKPGQQKPLFNNFLSTFKQARTYVTPRSETAELGFHF